MNNEQITNQGGKTITLRLPKISSFSVQTLILILLIGVGVLQTAQLYGLKASIANASVKPSIAAPAGSSGTSGSSLPTMVGGC